MSRQHKLEETQDVEDLVNLEDTSVDPPLTCSISRKL
jgi:hypothetical protein